MTQKPEIKLFDEKLVRTVWDDEQEKWYFSVVDVVEVLTDSPNPRKYWSVLKNRLLKEGSELTTNCSQLKMLSRDGKYYKTDALDTEQLFRFPKIGDFATECKTSISKQQKSRIRNNGIKDIK